MADRREVLRRRIEEATGPFLEPGEEVQVAAPAMSGPSPWLTMAFGGALGMALFNRSYGVLLTDRRVIFLRASMWTSRPKGLAFSVSRSGTSVAGFKPGAVWTKLRIRRPDGREVGLHFPRLWREEAAAIRGALAPPQAT